MEDEFIGIVEDEDKNAFNVFDALQTMLVELGISEEKAKELIVKAGDLQTCNEKGLFLYSDLIKTLAIMVKNELGIT